MKDITFVNKVKYMRECQKIAGRTFLDNDKKKCKEAEKIVDNAIKEMEKENAEKIKQTELF